MKSIMHDKKSGTCYLCMLLDGDYSPKLTQEHHVEFGTGNRWLSEHYGLKVYLCIRHHLHDGGPKAVHRNAEVRKMLDKAAQKAFERKYPTLSFRAIFGKNHLSESDFEDTVAEEAAEDAEPGFAFIEDGIEDFDW